MEVRSPTSFASLPREVKQVRTHLPQLAPKPFKIILVSSTELMTQIGYRKEFQSRRFVRANQRSPSSEQITRHLSFALTKG